MRHGAAAVESWRELDELTRNLCCGGRTQENDRSSNRFRFNKSRVGRHRRNVVACTNRAGRNRVCAHAVRALLLLQLLAIKIRQREGQTLEGIRRELKELTGDLLERRVALSLAPALANGADQSVISGSDEPVTWRRIAVADGIELSVRSDSPVADDGAIIAMREAVRAALGREEHR